MTAGGGQDPRGARVDLTGAGGGCAVAVGAVTGMRGRCARARTSGT